MSARLQTWFPFAIQICLNGREWLARQLDGLGVSYERLDNCLLGVSDWQQARRGGGRTAGRYGVVAVATRRRLAGDDVDRRTRGNVRLCATRIDTAALSTGAERLAVARLGSRVVG